MTLTLILALTVASCGQGGGARQVTLAGGPVEAPRVVAQALTPVEVRTTLEKLLGQHAMLAVRFMRAEVTRNPALGETAVSALVDNTEDLTAAVNAVHGEEAAARFNELWTVHVTAMFNYSTALAQDDQAGMDAARDELEAYRHDFSAFVADATDGALEATAVEQGLEAHVGHLLGQVDAYAAGDYQAAYGLQRQAYAHMFPTGKALAGGLTRQPPGEFVVDVDSAPQQLRSGLSMLLGEHVELAVDTMRAGVVGAPEFEAAAAALNANSADIAEGMTTLLGPRQARGLGELWATHIEHFMDYTVALVENDAAGRKAARRGLQDFHGAFGAFVSQATGGELPAAAVSRAIRRHDHQLLRQIEAYADEDYATAYQLSFDAYQHAFVMAADLASAIQVALGDELPVGGAQTGAGGTALP